ncbi:MAG TPA: hypothetical protein EYQ24_05845 [Bacteroidetes bacterium]|nr:hypothetical protein [Bacteroidota bacterium]HIL56605.1 hypothetical protein [Rhodothermales bacterium]
MALVFIHEGYSEYLEFTLRQAHAASPASEIVLLGNAENDRFPFVTHVDIGAPHYAEAAEEATRVYRHMATNPKAVALRWLQRWFWLRTFFHEAGLDDAWVLDSDVLLFAGEQELRARYSEGQPLALAIPQPQEPLIWAAGPHASYWTRETVEDFCRFAERSYTEPAGLARYEDKWAMHQREGIPGGVCDMTTLYLFAQETPHANVLEVQEGAAVEHNLNVPHNAHPDEYAMDGAAKALDWRDGQPWGTNRQTGEAVRFLALHLQGQAKGQIPALYTGPAFENQKALGDGLRRYFAARALAGRVKATAWRAVSRLRGR